MVQEFASPPTVQRPRRLAGQNWLKDKGWVPCFMARSYHGSPISKVAVIRLLVVAVQLRSGLFFNVQPDGVEPIRNLEPLSRFHPVRGCLVKPWIFRGFWWTH